VVDEGVEDQLRGDAGQMVLKSAVHRALFLHSQHDRLGQRRWTKLRTFRLRRKAAFLRLFHCVGARRRMRALNGSKH